MNIIQLQDNLKNLSDQQLAQAVQMPSQDTPPFLVVSELNRRKKMRDSFQAQQADQNKTTVAQDVVAAAGVPQQAASAMAQSLAPKTDMANNTGIMSIPQGGEPQRMAGGGRVTKMYDGGGTGRAKPYMPTPVGVLNDPLLKVFADREGMTVSEYLQAMDPAARQDTIDRVVNRTNRDRLSSLEPATDTYNPITRVNPSYEEQLTSVFPPDPEPYRLPPSFEHYGREGAPTMKERVYAARLPTFDDILAQNRAAQDQVSDDKLIALADERTPSWWDKPDETQLAYDALGSGKFMNVPTLGTQVRNAKDAIASLPMFDLDSGNPYSKLTAAEMNALASGNLSPEAADALQAKRTVSKSEAAAQARMGVQSPMNFTGAAPAADKAAADAKAKADAEAAAGGAGGAGGGGGGGGMGGGASGAPSTYEQALIDAIKNADKKAKQDKWMALAQMGLSLMSSQQPNFGAALGEAGAAAIPAFQNARDTADAEKLKLQGGLYDIAMKRQARNDALAAAAASAAGKQQSSGLTANQTVTAAKQAVDVAGGRLDLLGVSPTTDLSTLPPEAQLTAQTAINDYNRAWSDYKSILSAVNAGLGAVGSTESLDPTAEKDVSE